MTTPGAHVEAEERVRDAMVRGPRTLDVGASAQEAGQVLERPEVRAVLVCDDGRLVGVLTRKTLVREVVATGRDPASTPVGKIAEPPHFVLDADVPLEEAFRILEERDLERVPVTEDGRLVGVFSRAVVGRRLAQAEPPEDEGAIQA